MWCELELGRLHDQQPALHNCLVDSCRLGGDSDSTRGSGTGYVHCGFLDSSWTYCSAERIYQSSNMVVCGRHKVAVEGWCRLKGLRSSSPGTVAQTLGIVSTAGTRSDGFGAWEIIHNLHQAGS